MLTLPFRYQIAGVRQLHLLGGRALLGDDMGLGKTMQALMYAERHPQQRPVLVVCGASTKLQWGAEARQHFAVRSLVLEGRRAQSLPASGDRLLIINYDILHTWAPRLRALRPQLVILDESGAYLGNPGTRRTRAVRRLCQGVPHILALSGTPLENYPRQLWPTLNLLAPALFPNYQDFLHRYCGPRRVPWGNGWSFNGASNIAELHALLTKNLMVRRLTSEVMSELPNNARHVVVLPLRQRQEYLEAERDFLRWLGRRRPEKLSAAERAEGLVRLTTLKKLCGELKVPALRDWIEEFLRSGRKLVVFAWHRSVLDALGQHFRHHVRLDGSVSSSQRQARKLRFLNDPNIPLFLGQIRACGLGLDGLQKVCRDAAHAELAWTPGLHAQAEKRINRLGQTLPTRNYYLVAEHTLEERLLRVHQEKQDVIANVLDGTGRGERLDLFDHLLRSYLQGAP